MHSTTRLSCAAAYLAVAVTSGPVRLKVMSYAQSSRRRTALSVVAGTMPGDAAATPERPALRMFGYGWLTTVVNPKTVLFFMVFLLQFLGSGRPLLPRLARLIPTIFVPGALVDGS